MMTTETIKGFIHWKPACSYQEARWQWWPWDQVADWTMVMPFDIAFELPADWNPVAQELAQIEAARKLCRAEFAETMRRLDLRVSKLTAIGMATEVQS